MPRPPRPAPAPRADEAPPLRLEWRDAESLAPNPENWKSHPDAQTQPLDDLIEQVGWAGALLYNERTQRLIDGHARRELRRGEKVPVLIGSWSEDQERLILATLDPLGHLAKADHLQLAAIVEKAEAEVSGEALAAMLKDLHLEADIAKAVEGTAKMHEAEADIEPKVTPARITLRPVLLVEDAPTLERAIAATGVGNRAQALMIICRRFLGEGP